MKAENGHGLLPVVESWLDGLDLKGPDVVRATLVRTVAAELDDPATPKHAIPRLISQLRALLAEVTPTPRGNGKIDVGQLLKDVR